MSREFGGNLNNKGFALRSRSASCDGRVLKVTPRDGIGSPAHLCNLRILFGRRKRQKCQTDQTVVAMSLSTSDVRWLRRLHLGPHRNRHSSKREGIPTPFALWDIRTNVPS